MADWIDGEMTLAGSYATMRRRDFFFLFSFFFFKCCEASTGVSRNFSGEREMEGGVEMGVVRKGGVIYQYQPLPVLFTFFFYSIGS
jgi:hypothetical protein